MYEIRRGTYGGGDYDRHNNGRVDADYVDQNLNNPSARYLLFSDHLKLFLTDDGLPRWFSPFDARSLLDAAAASDENAVAGEDPVTTYPALFLGTDPGAAPLCAIRLADTSNFAADRFADLRVLAGVLPRSTIALASHARSLFAFHESHRFCGLCGDNTVSEQGGGRRRCVRNTDRVRVDDAASRKEGEADARRCRGTWYPRTDPAVIMLIVDPSGERVLLGRQARFPRSKLYIMYSCLAGHMEHGEGVDDAVRRETMEEVGITIGTVRFFGSQPWPFPYTLMLGCVVQATSEEINVDKNELEDALWISREELERMVEARKDAMNKLKDEPQEEELGDEIVKFVPPAIAIAGQMIDAYLAREDICTFPVLDHEQP